MSDGRLPYCYHFLYQFSLGENIENLSALIFFLSPQISFAKSGTYLIRGIRDKFRPNRNIEADSSNIIVLKRLDVLDFMSNQINIKLYIPLNV